MTEPNIHAAGFLVFNCTDEEVLSVSRKNNHEDLGLPCGKVEPDENPLVAALRELKEETGLELTNEQISDDCFICPGNSGKDVMTAIAMVCKKVPLQSSEEGMVGWAPKEKLCQGSFAEYNKELFETFARTSAPQPTCDCKKS